jgi:dihydroneopterin aldolase/2-amino-4-hydroxy-6-hydroxymethyldihydropteridine diphosphokinase
VIKKIEKEKNYKLIEALTFNIAEAILKYFDLVKEVKVIVKKINVPMEGIVDHVACHISRKKRI